MDWLRYYTDTLENRKIQDLPPALFKAWVNILCIARRADGVLPPVTDIAFRLRCSVKQANVWVTELERCKLLDRNVDETFPETLRPHDWDEHQYRSDNSTSRVQKHRMKQLRNVSETPRARDRTEQSRITEQKQTESEPATAMPPMQTVSEYPLTIAAIRKRDAAVDDIFVLRLVQQTIQHCLSSATFPEAKLKLVTDKVIAKAVTESFATGPPGHRTGLLLNRVPNIVVSWSQE